MSKLDFKKEAKKYEKEALEELKGLVSINSIYDESTSSKENPFGIGVRKALDYVGNLGERLGFKWDKCDHYCSELSFGEGDKIIDIYAHVDVVPVSPNWKSDPFTPTIIDNVMYARGSSDDKGPGIASLYGAKICLDNKLLDGVKLRVIFGGNEESGSLCLEHYFSKMHKGYPTYGFSPDANYPLIYGEKGIYGYVAKYKLEDSRIPAFKFGEATNIVLDETSLTLNDESIPSALENYLKEYPEIKGDYKNGVLHFKGQAVHGSAPWGGVNAGLHLLNFLGKVYNHNELCELFNNYRVGDGKAFGGDFSSEYFSSTSYCAGIISYDGKEIDIVINCRIPENIKIEEVLKVVQEKTKPDSIDYKGGSEGLLFDPKSEFIQTLLRVYQEESGDYESKPLTIGGGTYSRETKNTVAFGMEFPGVDTLMHQDGEFLRLDDFNKSIAIYAHAIAELACLARKK